MTFYLICAVAGTEGGKNRGGEREREGAKGQWKGRGAGRREVALADELGIFVSPKTHTHNHTHTDTPIAFPSPWHNAARRG